MLYTHIFKKGDTFELTFILFSQKIREIIKIQILHMKSELRDHVYNRSVLGSGFDGLVVYKNPFAMK